MALVFVLFISCQKELNILPTPHFDLSTDGLISDVTYTYYSNQEIQFINNSSDAITYQWDFGDGNLSEEENPSHTYLSPGLYSVSLLAKSMTDHVEQISVNVQIIEERLEVVKITEMDWYCLEDELEWSENTLVDLYFEIYTGGSSCCTDMQRNVVFREKIGSNVSLLNIPLTFYINDSVIVPNSFDQNNVKNYRISFVRDSEECVLADSKISMAGYSTVPLGNNYYKTVGGFLGAKYELWTQVHYE